MTRDHQTSCLPDANVILFSQAFSPRAAAAHFKSLRKNLDWQEATISIFGREIKSPRLSVWYGDAAYTYSGLTWPARPWPEAVSKIKAEVEVLADTTFNGVLANLYRDGRDSMGWHADDEPELGPDPVIASVVFGANRRFVFRRKNDPAEKVEMPLGDGDVLIMGQGAQAYWQHAVPKTTKPAGERINLTFRRIM